jgi:hypothetical protein
MNKLLKYIMVIALIILIIYYFLQKPKDKDNLINEVSFIEETDSEIDTKSAKSKPLLKKQETPPSAIPRKESLKKADEHTVSYLTAYRELKFFKDCAMILFQKEEGKDPMKSYIERTSFSDSIYVKTQQIQIEYYQVYVDKCLSLLVNKNESTREAFKRIEKRFNNTTPVTGDEISLKSALEIESRIMEITGKISQEKSGESHFTEEEQRIKIQRTLALSKEMTNIINRMSSPDFSETDELLLNNIMNEFRELNNTNTHLSNSEEIKFLQDELALVTPELIDFFRNNQTPDVFLIFADHLLNDSRGQFFFTDDVNNKLGIYDTEYIGSLNKIIVPFIACSLDYPCGPESDFAIKHCTYPLGNKPLACGKSIEDYYLEDLISSNQMIDFNNYFNYIMDNYAQN